MASRQKKERNNPSGMQTSVSTAPPVIRVGRGIRDLTRLLLFVRAGGRCEFDGCNDYLLQHPLTLTPGNFAQMAHIVAFKEEGPRGKSAHRPAYINDVGNLMLLCPQCHKLIDDHPDQYSVSTLQKYKEAHEDRILHVTGLGPDRKTTVVQLKARIAGQAIAIPVAQVTKAVAPRYPTDARGHVIDLTAINAEGKAFIDEACRCIKQRVERLYEPGMDVHETRHISLFALAPIPLLIYLGSQLSNKVPVDVFQRHRDTEDWVWKDSGAAAEYRFDKIREGRGQGRIGLILSLSGKINPELLPSDIDKTFTIYELTLVNMEPNPTYLRQRDDLMRFKDAYQAALRTVARECGGGDAIHLFPAIPAPVAVFCGRELLPKVDPKLLVYDYDKRMGGFTPIIEVN
jgi:SMODS-associated and fused to various effectors sensor domain